MELPPVFGQSRQRSNGINGIFLMEETVLYAGISLPLQQPKDELCAGN